ncbi:MAG: gephyrin-like molybdotransferase Glp, partial [Candidatus Neomarinimicrobiota bacterium]
ISVQEAHDRIRSALLPPLAETVPLTAAGGRVLAGDVAATMPQPRFTNSAMDGFALRAADTADAAPASPAMIEVSGGVSAGDDADLAVSAGQCVRIMTGAQLPVGTDTVVKVEDTDGFDAETVRVPSPVPPGQHVRREGEDVRRGQRLITAGTSLNPGELGLLATHGFHQVEVYRRPGLALLATGNELVEPGAPLAPGQVYNSNVPVLARLATLAGAHLVMSSTLGDDPAALAKWLGEAIESCQLVVTSAGVSMGRSDHVRSTLQDVGFQEDFWRVAQKPGMPLLFGRAGQALVFGLPGNPVSAFVCFMEYVAPALAALQGQAPAPKLPATLAAPFPAEPEKHRFLFGRVGLDDGRLLAVPSGKLGSHMLSGVLGANCILEAPPAPGPLPVGAPVSINLLPWAQPLAAAPATGGDGTP